MRSPKQTRFKSKLIPYVLFPMMIGVFTGILIFLFKIASSAIMDASENVYSFVRENPVYLPLLVLGAALIGAVAALILKRAKECRGGGIPTAVASIRGLVPMKWIQGSFVLFVSSLLTYLVGVPLGNEGPSVQMGTALGKGGSVLFCKNRRAWGRYFMTAGACSGFAIATGAPLSGVLFALEESHRKFSTTLFAVASISVLFGTVTQRYLSFFFRVDTTFFDLTISQVLPMKYLWAAVVIGAVCGGCSLVFAKGYRLVKALRARVSGKIHFALRIVVIFAVVAVLGFVSADFIGTGHGLIEDILHGKTIWYAILIALVIRSILLIFANSEGVSGGIFVPNLAFGAMIASLITDGLIAARVMVGEYYAILVVVGMASFLAASSRTPITAIAFSAEALCVGANVLPVIFGVVISYIIAEISGRASFADEVIESRTEEAHRGKPALIIDTHMTVKKGSFADGMEIRDILWPPTCTVLSIDRNRSRFVHHSIQEVREGDVIHLHYQTFDPEYTLKVLTDILGEQGDDTRTRTHCGSEEHLVPTD